MASQFKNKWPLDLEAAFAHEPGEPVPLKPSDVKLMKAAANAVMMNPKLVPTYTQQWRLLRRVFSGTSKVSKKPCIVLLYDLSQMPPAWAAKDAPVFLHINDLTRGLLRRIGITPSTCFLSGPMIVYPVPPSQKKHAEAFRARHAQYIGDAPIYEQPLPATWKAWGPAVATMWKQYTGKTLA